MSGVISHPGMTTEDRLTVIFGYTEYFEITKLPSGSQIGTLRYGNNLKTTASYHKDDKSVIDAAYTRILIDMYHEVFHIEKWFK